MGERGGMRESKTSESRLSSVDRQRRALELRKAGVGFQDIADQLGYEGPSGAYYSIKRALAKVIKAPAEEVRDLELARLDAMIVGLWTKARAGNEYAVDRVLKIMDRRAAYLGLDKPKEFKVAHDMEVFATRIAADMGLNPLDVLAEAERIVASAGVTD